MSRTFDGYPTPVGSSVMSIKGIQGPGSYTQITPGMAPAVATGGQTIQASDFGLKYFDFVSAGLTDTGINRVECIPGGRSNGAPKGACTSYTLRWVVVATGAEVAALVDLSSEWVRVKAVGPK